MNAFIAEVDRLEKKYERDGKRSFTFVPDDECRKFYRFTKQYEQRQEKVEHSHWISYCRTKKYREAMDNFLRKTQTSIYSVDEITEMLDRDPCIE